MYNQCCSIKEHHQVTGSAMSNRCQLPSENKEPLGKGHRTKNHPSILSLSTLVNEVVYKSQQNKSYLVMTNIGSVLCDCSIGWVLLGLPSTDSPLSFQHQMILILLPSFDGSIVTFNWWVLLQPSLPPSLSIVTFNCWVLQQPSLPPGHKHLVKFLTNCQALQFRAC